MNISEGFKDEMNKFIDEIYENISKQQTEMKELFQDMKVEIENLNRGKTGNENFEIQTETSEDVSSTEYKK